MVIPPDLLDQLKYYKISKERTAGVMERTFSNIFAIKNDVIIKGEKRLRRKPNKNLKVSKAYEFETLNGVNCDKT